VEEDHLKEFFLAYNFPVKIKKIKRRKSRAVFEKSGKSFFVFSELFFYCNPISPKRHPRKID